MIALDRLRDRTAGEVLASDVALERAAQATATPMLRYRLPSGRVVLVHYQGRAPRWIEYALGGGATVQACLDSDAEQVEAARRVWGAL